MFSRSVKEDIDIDLDGSFRIGYQHFYYILVIRDAVIILPIFSYASDYLKECYDAFSFLLPDAIHRLAILALLLLLLLLRLECD